jgi:hypothetical protein
VNWTGIRANAVRGGLPALVAAAVLAWPSVGLADDPPVVTRAPDIEGTLVVGQTLRAVNGAWNGSADAATGFTWLRCSDADFEDCTTIPKATGATYQLVDEDAGSQMRVTLWATLGDDTSYKASDLTAAVKTTSGTTPEPGGGGGGTPGGSTFDITAPPTKPTGTFPAGVKRIKPKPSIRITGSYTRTGAKLTRFTVKAPVGATTTLACSKGTCPSKKLTIKGGHTSHVAKFEKRALKAGTRIQLTVARKGYVSEITTLTIRAKKAPSRSDSCLLPGKTKTQKCAA